MSAEISIITKQKKNIPFYKSFNYKNYLLCSYLTYQQYDYPSNNCYLFTNLHWSCIIPPIDSKLKFMSNFVSYWCLIHKVCALFVYLLQISI